MTEALLSSPPTAKHKRGHGEGTIKQLAGGRWQGRIMLGRKPDGQPDRPWVTGATRGEVQKKLAELSRKAEQGMRADASKERQTLAAYLDTWLDAARMSTRPRTHQRYAQIVRLHIVPTLGQTKLSALRPDAIQRLYAAKIAEGLAPRTVDKIHVVLHRALKMAVRWGYLARNPADDVDKPKAPKYDVSPPEGAELLRLIDTAAASSDRLAALWTLAIHTGGRQGELLGLQWHDVDLDRGTLTIRRTLQEVKGTVPEFGEPKSETSRRTISLAAVAVQTLRQHKARQAEERLAAADWADNDLVFCSQAGTPLMWRNVIRDFKKALKRAGLPETVRFHDLRHAHAVLLLRSGTPLKVASQRLGHSTIAVTADIYSHVTPDMDSDAAERVAQALTAVK